MTTLSKNTLQPQDPPPSTGLPNLSDFATLAAKLQETAQALLVFCQSTANPKRGVGAGADKESASRETTPDETRSYKLPGYIVKGEREMLEAYDAESWQEMLDKVYEQLYATAMLMQHFPAEEEMDGFSVQLIAENLMVPLGMLSKLCSLIAAFRLVPAHSSVPHHYTSARLVL